MSSKKKPAKAKASAKKGKAAKPNGKAKQTPMETALAAVAAMPGKKSKAAREKKTGKGDIVVSLLQKAGGATHAEMQEATGWLPHTLRSFLSRQVRKVLGHTIITEQDKDGVKRYRIKTEK